MSPGKDRYAIFRIVALLLFSAAAIAQQKTLALDPAQSKVQFTLDTTFHTVHGTFQLKPGAIQFTSQGGPASGDLVVSAASGDSGSKSRDHKMTHDILEAGKYPDITFTAHQMKGTLAPSGASQFQLEGVLTLHGQQHPITLDIKAEVQGNSLSADTSFAVPYIKWGMKNPSAMFLRVNDTVQIHIHAVGQIR